MEISDSKEARELLQRCKDGQDDAFRSLVSLYTPMIVSLIRKHSLEYDDAFSEACMALYKAASYYDLEQSEVTFGLYAKICISNRLKDLVRSGQKDEPIISDLDIETVAVKDTTQSRLEKEEDSARFRAAARAVLSDYEYRVLALWLAGLKTADIALRLSEEAKSVDNAKARIIKKLRRSMSGNN